MFHLLCDHWIQHHVLNSTSYANTFSKVRNVSILHFDITNGYGSSVT